MGGHKTISSTDFTSEAPAPPPPIPDYIITGEITPNATGNYFYAGIFEYGPYYKRADSNFFLWSSPGFEACFIAAILGDIDHEFWMKEGEDLIGEYFPVSGATGNAIVSAGA